MMKKLLSCWKRVSNNERSSTAGTAYAPEGRIASRSTILYIWKVQAGYRAM